MGDVRRRRRTVGGRTLTARRVGITAAIAAAAAACGASAQPAPPLAARAAAAGAEARDAAPSEIRIVTDNGSFEVVVTTDPVPLPLNEYFELVVDVREVEPATDTNPIWVGIDAQMPGHAHGMNTRPQQRTLGDGRFVFAGMLFHMAGDWEIVVDVAKGRLRDQATLRLQLR
jgi:hypothetical protein